jgi:hypothetical protein
MVAGSASLPRMTQGDKPLLGHAEPKALHSLTELVGPKPFPFDPVVCFANNPSGLLNFSMPKSPNRSFAIVNLR